MAATITWKGAGRQATGNSGTETWAALKIAGTGGGPTAAAADGAFQGANAVTCVVSKQHVALYVDLGAGNELDFTGGGTEEGELIYIWASFLAPAALATRAAGGFGIFLESSTPGTAQYHEYYMDGSDSYSGGFKRFILDPTKTVSASAGTAINLASVRYIGIFADVGGATLRFDNLICDAIDVGNGLRITGTSTTDDLKADLLADELTNRYGIVTGLNTAGTSLGLAGELDLGDNVGTTAVTITDVDAKYFVEEPTYYNGTSVVPSVPLAYAGINCVGNGTGATSITFGKLVGTESGRNGITVVGNSTYTTGIDWDDGNVNTNLWYGCSFENLSGVLSWGTNTAHKLLNSSFSGCEQFDPVGGVVLRNINFTAMYDDGVANASKNSALLWNGSIDIQKSNFLANSHTGTDIAHGIEHPAAGTFTYTDLLFSGNEVDIHFSAATGNLTVSKSGTSNPATSTNDSTGTVTIQGSVAVSITAEYDGSPVEGASVYLKLISGDGGDVILNGVTNASGILSGSWSGATPVSIDTTVSEVRDSSGAIPLQGYTLGGQITASGYSVTALMIED